MAKKNRTSLDKKTITFKSPDLSKMQEVVIDFRTKIYIAKDADPEEARRIHLARQATR